MRINIYSVKSKLLAVQLPIIMVIIAIIGVVIYSRVAMSINQQQDGYLKLASKDIINMVDVWLKERMNEAVSYSNNEIFRNAILDSNFAGASKMMKTIFEGGKLANGTNRLEDVFIANSDGVILSVYKGGDVVGLDLKTIPSYAKNIEVAKVGKVHISSAAISPASKRPIALVTAPIYNGDKVIGILGLPFELSVINDIFIKNQKFSNTGYVYLLDTSGLIIAHIDNTLVATNIKEFDFGSKLLQQQQGFYNYTFNGKTKTGYMAYMKDIGWIAVSSIETADLRVVLNDIILVTVLGIAIGGLLIFFIIYFVTRKLMMPLKTLKDVSQKISEGDVDVTLNINRRDEMGDLAKAFNSMLNAMKVQAEAIQSIAEGDLTKDVVVRSEKDLVNKSLNKLVQQNNEVMKDIKNSSEQVEAVATQVAIGSQTLAQNATEQACTVEEINASIEELATRSKENANNSRKASDMAENAREISLHGTEKLKEMMNSMEEINHASGNISKIIKVIDEIAFQTNILSLNAAVEAARAGVHGKGFAVVAEEVRNLAARSSEAAKETTQLIEGSIRKVEAGTDIASDTVVALNKIMDTIQDLADTINLISNASSEEATSVSEISIAINQVSSTTQTNSATAEESAAASEELSSQAVLLRESIARFKLKK